MKKKRKSSIYGKCLTADCAGLSQHATGYCVECRKKKCKRPGCDKMTVINLKSSGFCDSHYQMSRIGL